MERVNCVFLIHGGAGTISKDRDPVPYWRALKRIMLAINTYIAKNISSITALDIVEYAVKHLEDEELFNAGKGSVYTSEETHEMDASIMDGESLKCGSVSLIKTVKNPISAARVVLNHPYHNFIVGSTAETLAADHGLEIVSEAYFDTVNRKEQLYASKRLSQVALDHNVHVDKSNNDVGGDAKGTVGCVCMLNGHVAAATSTGGMTNKLPGRIGDSPVIGAGNYANDKSCAVSATGNGEEFTRRVVAHDVSCRMIYGKDTLEKAAHEVVFKSLPEDIGGLIAVDANGNYTSPFNSAGMFRGIRDLEGRMTVGIWEDLKSIDDIN